MMLLAASNYSPKSVFAVSVVAVFCSGLKHGYSLFGWFVEKLFPDDSGTGR